MSEGWAFIPPCPQSLDAAALGRGHARGRVVSLYPRASPGEELMGAASRLGEERRPANSK